VEKEEIIKNFRQHSTITDPNISPSLLKRIKESEEKKKEDVQIQPSSFSNLENILINDKEEISNLQSDNIDLKIINKKLNDKNELLQKV
jgi:hypothetical protein